MEEARRLDAKTADALLARAKSKTTKAGYAKRGLPAASFANALLAAWRQGKPDSKRAQELRDSPAPPKGSAAFKAQGVLKALEKKDVGPQAILDLAGVILRLHEIKRDAPPDTFRQLEGIIEQYWKNSRPPEPPRAGRSSRPKGGTE